MKALVKVWGYLIASSPVIAIIGLSMYKHGMEAAVIVVGVSAGFIGATFLGLWMVDKSERMGK